MCFYFCIGVFGCVPCIFFLLVRRITCHSFCCYVIFCFFFFLARRCHSLQLLTSLICTWIVMYWWYHVVLHWCNDILYRHLLAWGCNNGYGTTKLFINGCHCALTFWNIWCVFMELHDPGTFPMVNIIFCRSQRPRGLRRRSTAVRLLGSWVRIPLGTWTFVCCECCVCVVR